MLPSSPHSDTVKKRVKYPRPIDCPHQDREEFARGVCYLCSTNIKRRNKTAKNKYTEGGMEGV
jgi:hypothetical protein